MFPFDVAIALSVWSSVPRRRLAALLAHLARGGPMPGAGGASLATLEALVFHLDPGCDPAPQATLLTGAASRALEMAHREGIVPVVIGTPGYPPLLAATSDPPVVLWVRGVAESLERPAVAVVGSRAATEEGLEVAARLAGELAANGLVVVSGLARGIDAAAHRGALEEGGLTIAVLGSGPDLIYPPEHDALANQVAASGALVSEQPPRTPPRPLHFPARNRIISGLALGVVVVEAAERSGALITADRALEQGREVMAVPGSVLDGRHGGTHGLIRDGAMLVESGAEVALALGRQPISRLVTTPGATAPGDPVLAAIGPGEAVDTDQLVERTGLDAPVLLARLLMLELDGCVRRAAGGRFVRPRRLC